MLPYHSINAIDFLSGLVSGEINLVDKLRHLISRDHLEGFDYSLETKLLKQAQFYYCPDFEQYLYEDKMFKFPKISEQFKIPYSVIAIETVNNLFESKPPRILMIASSKVYPKYNFDLGDDHFVILSIDRLIDEDIWLPGLYDVILTANEKNQIEYVMSPSINNIVKNNGANKTELRAYLEDDLIQVMRLVTFYLFSLNAKNIKVIDISADADENYQRLLDNQTLKRDYKIPDIFFNDKMQLLNSGKFGSRKGQIVWNKNTK